MQTVKKRKQLQTGKMSTGALFPDKRGNINHRFGRHQGRDVFYKVLSLGLYRREIAGYNAIKDHYPVSNLIGSRITSEKGVLIFERDENVTSTSGLLFDVLDTPDQDKIYSKVIDIYQKVFPQTLKLIKQSADDVFYKKRIQSRLIKYYKPAFWRKYDGERIKFKGKNYVLTPTRIIQALKMFYSPELTTWGILSQGDPLDINISTTPRFFDYYSSGYNYLSSEFANFFWNNLAMGDYFLIKSHPDSCASRPNAKRILADISFRNGEMFFSPGKYRKKIVTEYISKVFNPCLQLIRNKNKRFNWYREFKHFIAMRILCSFDLNQMSELDQKFSLMYLQILFDSEYRDPNQLVEELWK